MVCSFLGIYTLRLDPKSKVNRLFFGLTILLAIWAFAYTFVYPAPDKETAWFWIRFAAVSVCFWPAIHLHFFIELVLRKKFPKINRILPVVYLPAVLLLIEYIIAGTVSIKDIFLCKSGWMEILYTESIWFWVMMVYMYLYLIIILFILLWWKAKSGKMIVKRQANIIIAGMIATVLSGIIVEMVLPMLNIFVVPAIAPAFFILWAVALWYTIIKLRFMKITPEIAVDEIISRINEFLFFVDPEETIINANLLVYENLGYEPDEISEIRFSQLFVEKQLIKNELDITRKNQKTQRSIEVNLITKDSKLIPARLSGSAIWKRGGDLLGMVFVGEDLRPKKQMQDLKTQTELSKLKSRFISAASHEFKTPLSTILLSIDTIENYSQRLTPYQIKDYYKNIRSAIRQMTNLLDDIMIIEKSNSGKTKFTPVHIDLKSFIERIIEEFRTECDANHRHQFTFVHKGDFKDIKMDKKLLRYILSNLLSNAIKYSPEGGKIDVTLFKIKDMAVIQVKDEGIGMSEKEIPLLFESFHRGKNASKIPGTGLGLAIVKDAVNLHHGTVSASSEEGKGSVFTVTLPIK
jgi:PAS domain S-box-containing protein